MRRLSPPLEFSFLFFFTGWSYPVRSHPSIHPRLRWSWCQLQGILAWLFPCSTFIFLSRLKSTTVILACGKQLYPNSCILLHNYFFAHKITGSYTSRLHLIAIRSFDHRFAHRFAILASCQPAFIALVF